MGPRTNPYAPGAATLPPDLAGRDDIIEKAAIALYRFRSGLSARSLLFVGLRGVGKLVGWAGHAKSYAEPLFEYPEIGPLKESEAKKALEAPAEKLGVRYDKAALTEILKQTQAYPYFLQEWGKHSWQCASASPITRKDAVSVL